MCRLSDANHRQQRRSSLIIRKIYAMCVERPAIDSTTYGETGENSNQIATNVEQRDC